MELQSSCWFQAKTAQSNVSGNLFYNGPRAGINMNDGFGGGNSLQSNLIFNQCRQVRSRIPVCTCMQELQSAYVSKNCGFRKCTCSCVPIDSTLILGNVPGTFVCQ